ncbi:MAG: GTPase HflX [Candidatus Rokubacteria bacterium RIFCSPLOWO2_12_FULL_69_21]|nr:MAG: GTPase HflX [Candidatus Rokubacteria bacterium RIFCSPLOWO2_12_FULL_69_21]
MFDTNGEPERAVLVTRRSPKQTRWEVQESLAELARLTASAGAVVVGNLSQDGPSRSPRLYLGKGKVEELRAFGRDRRADVVIADDNLSPAQERDLSKALGLKVIDRRALILDIFAQRARTSEGKLQVELAQLTYLLPRLVRRWTHLERLGGGIGTRGPGETQLESDRRIIRRRILQIQGELKRVQRHRRLLRDRRRASGWPVVALVGYTNAGKTTLLNRLAGSEFRVADQLFVTLDPAARLVALPNRQPFILTDTVGFIRKLPPELIAAFRATLEELYDADVLLHVADASHPGAEEQMRAVERLLSDLDLGDRLVVLALNKVDRVEEPRDLERLSHESGGIPVSALTEAGFPELLAALEGALRPQVGHVTLRIPYADGPALALCYRRGRVLRREDGEGGVLLDVALPRPLLGQVAAYQVKRG